MDSFTCRRCGRHNDRRSARFRVHGVAPHYCDRCFAEDATGKRGIAGWLIMVSTLAVYLFAGTAVALTTVGIPLTLLRVPWFAEASVLTRAIVLIVPGMALGLLLWRRRGR